MNWNQAIFPSLKRASIYLTHPVGAQTLPSSAEEGWTRHQKDIAEPPYPERTGWCWSINKKKWLINTTNYGFALSRSRFAPVCAGKVASRLLLTAHPPLLSCTSVPN